MIEMKPAAELRPGDVFSTDGGIVESVVLLTGGAPDEIAVSTTCHGINKFAYLAPDFPCPIWTPDV